VARGGNQFGQLHIVKMKAFLYWLKDCQRRGLPLDLDNGGFGKLPKLEKTIKDYRDKEERKNKEEMAAKIPDKFPPTPYGDGTPSIAN